MTETQQRFLRAIAERVPKENVVEVHLFPAIRQGGVETGVAVVAERPRLADDGVLASNGDAPDVASEPVDDPPLARERSESVADDEGAAATAATFADLTPRAVEAEAVEDDGGVVAARLTVHTARYRLTLKGVDRGKWEVDVVAEAAAPLAAVDAVVRGVQRRAGEGAEPDRLTGEAFLDALDAPLATLER